MDTELHFKNSGDERSTPQWLFDLLDKHFHFNLDVCANESNHKCARYYSPEINGLKQEWKSTDVIWMNPPYSCVKDWVSKAANSPAQCVALVAARPDTIWFHDYVFAPADCIIFIKGRLKFNGLTTPAPFPSALVFYNCKDIPNEILSLGFAVDL